MRNSCSTIIVLNIELKGWIAAIADVYGSN